jgi:hypothetical protein
MNNCRLCQGECRGDRELDAWISNFIEARHECTVGLDCSIYGIKDCAICPACMDKNKYTQDLNQIREVLLTLDEEKQYEVEVHLINIVGSSRLVSTAHPHEWAEAIRRALNNEG